MSDEIRKLNWLKESMEEGQAWLRSQRGYGDWKKSMDTLAGRPDAQMIPTYRSQLVTGRLKRNTVRAQTSSRYGHTLLITRRLGRRRT
jgi:hypothetical protein